MIDRFGTATTFFAVGLTAAVALSVGAHSAAALGANAGSVELSAQQNKDKNKKPPPRPVQRRPAPHVNAPHRPPPHVNVQRRAPTHNVQQNVPGQNAPNRFVRPPSSGSKVVTPQNAGPKIINRATTGKPGSRTVRAFTPRGSFSRTVTAGRLRGMPGASVGRTSIRGRNYSVWRRGHRVRYHGGYRTFVALSALTALAIAGSQYYPYAYIDAPEDYCDGLTPDGCQLVWEDVQTVEGDIIPQCVAYCPWEQ
ncbi:MAG TPA: hypothetical protein VFL51_07575 [Pseudolabrys sp.]|nr:hypothetical protein [Pseudolabrys sp.]